MWRLLPILLLVASSASADQVLLYKISVQRDALPPMKGQEATVFLGKDRARLETMSATTIYQRDLGKYIYIQGGKYIVFDVPVDFEKLVSDEERPTLTEVQQSFRMVFENEATDETRRVEPWEARLLKVRGVSPLSGQSVETDLWKADVGLDEDLLRGLMRNYVSLDFFRGQPEDSSAGVAVLTEQTETRNSSVYRATTRLAEIREEDVDPALYEPPADAERIDFRLDFFIVISDGTEHSGPPPGKNP